jgi:dUTP pyrophosphatase
MEVKIKLIEGGSMPKKGSEGAAAYDCYAREISYNAKAGYTVIKLGFAIAVPNRHVLKLYPRSSITNRGMIMGNSVGIVDSDYRGEVMVRLYPNASSMMAINGDGLTKTGLKNYCDNVYRKGEACAQFIIEELIDFKLDQVDELDETERGEGGFGSTDKTIG